MSLSRTIQKMVEEELRKTNNISRVSRVLGVSYAELKDLYGTPPAPYSPAIGPEPEDITTLAKPGWEPYVIAVKRAGCSWPMKYNDVIKDARIKFDAGTHEMYQHHVAGWVVQYLRPRAVPVAPRRFFQCLEY